MEINNPISIGNFIANGTFGSILYIDANGKLAEDNTNLFYDYTNKRVGIGTNVPSQALELKGSNASFYLNDTANGGEFLFGVSAGAFQLRDQSGIGNERLIFAYGSVSGGGTGQIGLNTSNENIDVVIGGSSNTYFIADAGNEYVVIGPDASTDYSSFFGQTSTFQLKSSLGYYYWNNGSVGNGQFSDTANGNIIEFTRGRGSMASPAAVNTSSVLFAYDLYAQQSGTPGDVSQVGKFGAQMDGSTTDAKIFFQQFKIIELDATSSVEVNPATADCDFIVFDDTGEFMRVDAANRRLGIFDSTPSHTLTISDTAADSVYIGQSGKNLDFDSNSGILTLTSTTTTPYLLTGNNAIGTFLRIDNTSQSAVDAQWYIGTWGTSGNDGNFILLNEDINVYAIEATQTGLVGINTAGASPTERFQVTGGNIWLTDDDDKILLGDGKDVSLGYTLSTTSLDIDLTGVANTDMIVKTTGDANTLFIDGQNARVGIKTNTPSVELDVNGTIAGVNVTSGNNPGHTHSGSSIGVHGSQHESGGSDPVNHDSLTGFVANEHIDWTNATQDFLTSGKATIGKSATSGHILDVLGSITQANIDLEGGTTDGTQSGATVAGAIRIHGGDGADKDVAIGGPDAGGGIDLKGGDGGTIKYSLGLFPPTPDAVRFRGGKGYSIESQGAQNNTAGDAGNVAFTGGEGGDIVGTSTGNGVGGNGGPVQFVGGAGGTSTGSATNTQGDGGLMSIAGGAGDTGGDCLINAGAGTSANGTVKINSTTQDVDTIIYDDIDEIFRVDASGQVILINTTKQLQFGDSGTYINQGTDGHLDLIADVSIDLNNKLFVEADGDTYWTGDGSGVPFGHAYMFEGTTTVTVASADTWYELTSGLTSGEVNEVTFGGSHYLAVDKAGRYEIKWGASMNTATAGQELMTSITVNSADNNTALNSESTNAKSAAQHSTVASANKDCQLSGSTILDLAANDQVSIIVLNKTLATDIVVEHVTLTLSMVGGT